MQPIAALAERCTPILQEALEPDEAERLAAALRVIADPARLRLLSLIHAQP
ncbi:MAG: transcriptional regulator, partial [Actinobacteria bacterium]|nr:transcriptional regulator [Actinomycetota bacterium]